MKKLLALLLLLALLMPPSALAAEKLGNVYVSVCAMEDGGQMPSDAVKWYKNEQSKYYLFLPGAADLSNARIWFTGVTKVTVGKNTYQNGDLIDLPASGKSFKLKAGTRNYTLNVMQGSPIPSLFLSTESGSMKAVDAAKDVKEAGALRMLAADGSFNYDAAFEYIKLRGNTSAKFNKKGYTLKLTGKADLAGMGKAKKWVLTSNARDKALIRNQIVYNIAEYVGLPYTPECRQVEVYLNHEYNGTYILQEKIEIGEERVDITDLEKATEAVNDAELDTYPLFGAQKLARNQFKCFDIPNDPEDVTGGYLFEYENYQPRYEDEPCAYTTKLGKVIVIKEPESASVKQMEYISSFVQGYENAIFAEDGKDPATGKHYSEFVDFTSLTLKYILEEFSKNCDGNKSSQYYFKPADSESTVAFAGPAWDYDTTFGDYGRERDSKQLLNPRGFYHNIINASKFWWPQLYAKADFLSGVKESWREKYVPAIKIVLGEGKDENGKLLSIEEYGAQIEQSAAMNFIRWPMKQSSENIANTGKTFSANLKYLTDYIQKRFDFLNEEWLEQ